MGADFLTNTGLQLDIKNKKLIDPVTNFSVDLVQKIQKPLQLFQITSELHPIFNNFKIITTAPDYTKASTNVRHHIITTGPPTFSKPRPLSPARYEAAKIEFNKLAKEGIVRPSSSPWASPLHMVKKADGSWRPCGDFRRLNSITKPDRYPVPNIEHIHHKMQDSKIFSKLDLTKAYHFIPMAEPDIEKTAVCTPFGSFEYLRMPFGLRMSSTFQRYIDNIFRDLNFVTADILVYSKSTEEHKLHINEMMERLTKNGLRATQTNVN